jgi:ADP-ribose pyrophosphatase YjhB (NUDIX family)
LEEPAWGTASEPVRPQVQSSFYRLDGNQFPSPGPAAHDAQADSHPGWQRVIEMTRYDNTPTVVVVLVPLRGGLLMVRRALPGEGQGKLALPGGYQMLGQTWQEAGAREVVEETGVVIFPEALRVVTVETTPDRRQNLLFCQSPPVEHQGAFAHDAEVSEVLVIHEPVGTAFPLHTRVVRQFFGDTSVL